jgi:tetratricopeptide (TPR) repeat protein
MINNLVTFNKLAMENLSQNKLEMAYHFMHRAENILSSLSESQDKDSLTLITFNNQACLYKALGQPNQSVEFLHKAIVIAPNSPEDYFNLARCYLNLSLLKSENRDTDAALNHSMKALDLLSNHCEEDIENYYENLCTAFNIIASQHKIKGNQEESQRVYKRGFDISLKFLGESHSITQIFVKQLEKQKIRFIKKPKSTGIKLPKMLNRAWPKSYNSNRNSQESRRLSSLNFHNETKTHTKRIFTKEVINSSANNELNNTINLSMRKTQHIVTTTSPLVNSRPKINKNQALNRPATVIQSVFRAFLAKKLLEDQRNSKLTRRQLAEKKAIMALQEFEILKEIAEKENPYFEAKQIKTKTKPRSRKSSSRNPNSNH